jgi:hypothetical protein
VSIDVPHPREQVYDFLDVIANHEPFTDHMMRCWEYSGSDRGVGSKARVRVDVGGGRTDLVEIETIAAERPARIVEQNISAGGRRVANGTYALEVLAGGRTRVTFEYAWQRAPRIERLVAPLERGAMRRRVERAMERLAEQLAGLQVSIPRPRQAHLDA